MEEFRMNSLNLVGRVAKEIEVKEVGEKNTKILRNVLAVVDNYDREKTNFIQFTIFGKNAENFEKVVDKGDLVGLMNAKLKIDQYENKEGEKRNSIYALASNWQLYRKKKDNGEEGNKKQNDKQKEQQHDSEGDWLTDDDMPF